MIKKNHILFIELSRIEERERERKREREREREREQMKGKRDNTVVDGFHISTERVP